ncbi:MAG: glycosyltransferase family 4 protein [Candidatus Magasanikbacteria bacterium]
MKTLLVTLEYTPFKGGVAEYYSNIFENWQDDNFFVLTQTTTEKINENKRIIRKNLLSKFFSWLPTFYYLYKEIKRNKFKHILVGQILPIGTIVWFMSLFFDFKYSVILHGMDYTFSQKRKRKKILTKFILNKAQNIIVSNSYLQKIVTNDYQNFSSKIFLVNPGVTDKNISISETTDTKKEFQICFVGRLVKRKGIDRTIEALQNIDKNKYPNINFVIAGSGPDENYLKNISKDERIKFVGKINDTEKWQLLATSDVFVMPARNIAGDFEGFGIVYLEANLAGLPVIACNTGGVSDAVINNETGLLLENDDTENIKNAIIKFYENKDWSRSLGEKGKTRAKNDFTWEKQTKQIFEIINKT